MDAALDGRWQRRWREKSPEPHQRQGCKNMRRRRGGRGGGGMGSGRARCGREVAVYFTRWLLPTRANPMSTLSCDRAYQVAAPIPHPTRRLLPYSAPSSTSIWPACLLSPLVVHRPQTNLTSLRTVMLTLLCNPCHKIALNLEFGRVRND